MLDPIDKFLEDLGRARGRVRTDLARLPASDPLMALLDEVDTILSRTETELGDINDVIRATKTMGLRTKGRPAWLRDWTYPKPLMKK